MSKIENFNFSGKKAIVRVDFNVPLNDKFEITDDTRIQAAKPTMEKIIGDGGSLIIMSHFGRPKGKVNPDFSLKHIQAHLSKVLGVDVDFIDDSVGEKVKERVSKLKAGEVLLLENLRFYAEEEGKAEVADSMSDDEVKAAKAEMKERQKGFAKQLSELADVYVNDAFGTAHRAHASTAVIADYFAPENKMFGYLIESEVTSLDKVVKEPKRPFTAIMGGAKVSSKITIIENMLDKVDNLILGGGMTFTFVKARGGQIGDSICEDDYLELAKELEKKAAEKGVKLYLPSDVVIADAFSNDANTQVVPVDQIPDGWQGLDAGPETLKQFAEVIENSETILWNGPVGVFEMETFEKGSRAVAQSIVDGTKKGAFSLIGGGDSVACINKFEMADDVSYISTAGGALLEYLEGKDLPGIKAIRG